MTVKLVSIDRWINVKNELPKIGERVWACWGTDINNIDEMEYAEDVVRGKLIHRFRWRGRISPWEVLYWQPYFKPEPPKEEVK